MHHCTMKFKAAALAGALIAAGPAYAAAPAGFTVVERAITDAVSVHAGTAADNTGDIMTFVNPVYDATNTAKLGSDQGYCVRVAAGKSFECHWTLMLAKGQIAVDGPFFDTADSTMAITGGTGIYSGAHGEMRLHARDAKGTAFDFTYVFD